MNSIRKLEEILDKKDWSAAKKILAEASFDEISIPIKYYNLGYIALQEEHFVDAHYFFEKAKQSGLYSDEIDSALLTVKKKLDISSISTEASGLDSVVLTVKTLNSDIGFSLGLITVISGIIFALKAKKILYYSPILLLGGLLIGGTYYLDTTYKVGINIDDAAVYGGPSRIFEQIQILPKGLKVVAKEYNSEWSQIIYPSVYEGWMYKTKVKNL